MYIVSCLTWMALWCPVSQYLLPLEHTCDLSLQWHWSLPNITARNVLHRVILLLWCLWTTPPPHSSAQGWFPWTPTCLVCWWLCHGWALGFPLPSFPPSHTAWLSLWLFSGGHQKYSYCFPLISLLPRLSSLILGWYLGGFISKPNKLDSWLLPRIHHWLSGIHQLVQVAIWYPHVAYAALQKSLFTRWGRSTSSKWLNMQALFFSSQGFSLHWLPWCSLFHSPPSYWSLHNPGLSPCEIFWSGPLWFPGFCWLELQSEPCLL